MPEDEIELECTIELSSNNQEVLVNSLKQIVKRIEENGKKLSISNDTYSEPREIEMKELEKAGKFYSAFAKFNVSADLESIIGFVLDYAPSTIEVIKPFNLNVNITSLQAILNDISGRINEMDQKIKLFSLKSSLLEQENKELKSSK